MTSLKTPKGWTLLKGESLTQFLATIYNDDVDRDIICIAHPDKVTDGSIFAQLEYQDIGHVEVDAGATIDLVYIREKYSEDLRILNSENGLSPSEAVKFKSFAVRPQFDYQTLTLRYGIELFFGTNTAVNLYLVKLVKSGVLTLTLVANYASQISLNDWQIIPDSSMDYHKFNPSRDAKAQGKLDNLMLINRFI